MKEITTLAIDLAKNVFQLHGSDADARVVLQRRVRRGQLLTFLAQLPRCTVAMEACASSHHWAREIRALGHEVRLIAPQYVKAFCRGQKNDHNDAEAIDCAAHQPQLPQVAIKSLEQQALLSLHRIRKQLVKQRNALTNQLHGLMGEFGILLPQAPQKLRQQLLQMIHEDRVPQLLQAALRGQLEHFTQIEQRERTLSKHLEQLARDSEPCRRLMRRRGVGPLTATAFVAELADPRSFRNGRQVAAWLGLVPRQHSSGERTRLLGITKHGNCYLRQLLVHGARSALATAPRHDDAVSRWSLAVAQRRGANRAAVALANKTARHLWAMLRYPELT